MKFQYTLNPTTPTWNTTLWRYMPVEKFFDLVVNNQLFMTNAKKLTDQYEIKVTEKTVQALVDRIGESEAKKAIAKIAKYRKGIFLSCWAKKPDESYTLWKTYLGGNNFGVAIKTKAQTLRMAVEQSNRNKNIKMFLATVKYNDFIKPESVDFLTAACTKMKFYDSESEVRMFFVNDTLTNDDTEDSDVPAGHPLKIVPNRLIESIYLSPFCESWFAEVFKKTVNKLNGRLAAKIKISQILDK